MKRTFLYLLLPGLLVLSFSCKNETKKTDEGQVLASSSTSAEANASFTEGLSSFDLGDRQEARTSFTKAIGQDPKMAIAYIFRATTSNSPKDFADDMNAAKANMATANDWEKLYYDYTMTFLTSDWNKRLEATQKMVSTFPKSARAEAELGNTYLNGNQYDKAREAYQKAVELDPKWVGGYGALVNSYLFSEPKDFKKAEENALKVVELAPKSPGAEIALGDVYRAQNDLQKAKDAYSKAIDLNPNSSAAYYKRGNANTFLGNFDEARQDYTNGAKHDYVKFGEVQDIANTYLYANDRKMAMQYLMDQCKAMDASGAAKDQVTSAKQLCLQQCASIAMHTGDAAGLKGIVAMYEPVNDQLANDLGTQEAKLGIKADNLYWEAMTDAVAGNFDAAKAKGEEIKTTLATINDPNKLNSYDFLMGYIDMKQKNYTSAISHFEKTNPTQSMYNNFWLAMANEAAGNKDKAMGMYKEIVNYNFNDPGYALIRNEAKDKAK